MNEYADMVDSFLKTVSTYMASVYLPVLLASLIELLEDDKMNRANYYNENLYVCGDNTVIPYSLSAAYFLAYLTRIRQHIPDVALVPNPGNSHEENFILLCENNDDFTSPRNILNQRYSDNCDVIISKMRKKQNVYHVFERRCHIIQCRDQGIEIDNEAVEYLLNHAAIIRNRCWHICGDYLLKIKRNRGLEKQINELFFDPGKNFMCAE